MRGSWVPGQGSWALTPTQAPSRISKGDSLGQLEITSLFPHPTNLANHSPCGRRWISRQLVPRKGSATLARSWGKGDQPQDLAQAEGRRAKLRDHPPQRRPLLAKSTSHSLPGPSG